MVVPEELVSVWVGEPVVVEAVDVAKDCVVTIVEVGPVMVVVDTTPEVIPAEEVPVSLGPPVDDEEPRRQPEPEHGLEYKMRDKAE
jgi:hypothetical protein